MGYSNMYMKEVLSIMEYADCHLHLGYYKGGYDIEGIGFQLEDDKSWDVYYSNNEDLDLLGIGIERDKDFGVCIFNEQDENHLLERFHNWVETVLFIARNNNI